MRRCPAFVIRDLAALVSIVGVAGIFLALMLGEARRAASPLVGLRNLGRIAMAAGQYRLDNADYFPITLTYHPRGNGQPGWGTSNGWCSWSHMGKNNDAFWFSTSTGAFDVEAADRPLNPYFRPRVNFWAPTPPLRLPANAPERLQEGLFAEDPGDVVTYQRAWPNPTPGLTSYNDVGTSYHWNGTWWFHPLLTGTFAQKMATGTSWLATGTHIDPARFIWNADQYALLVATNPSPLAKIVNGFGDVNKSLVLFHDGHAAYQSIQPGQVYNTPDYHLTFSP